MNDEELADGILSAPLIEASTARPTIKFVNGYWTVFSGEQAIMTFASLQRALDFTGLTEAEVVR